MVLSKGVCVGTFFYLDVCTIECNISSISPVERYIGSIPSQSEPHKQYLASKRKLTTKKTMLWCQKLGHISENDLCTLKNKNIFDGLNYCYLEFDFCEHCIYGKQNCVQFYSSSHKYYGLLDLIHLMYLSYLKFLHF
jgi:hypothetical protein